MNKYQKAVASAVATGVLLFNGLLPVFASTILITGNGSDTKNEVVVGQNSTTAVTQSNTASVTNNINATSSTGKNDADDNTGGDVSIETGDAKTEVSVENTLNSNTAEVDCCGANDFDVEISGNGTYSDNKVELDINKDQDSALVVEQANSAKVDNRVDAKAKTGGNDAEDNTGGSVSVKTGDATTSVTLGTMANTNSAKVGGAGTGQGGSLSAMITGNGSDTDNLIDLDLDSWMYLVQGNAAGVLNDVYAKSSTGGNDADDNTGGEVEIETGDAEATVEVDNAVNFNWADADCGCLLEDLLAKIAGNGTYSDNKIEADMDSGLLVEQENEGGLNNELDAKAKTGYNDAEDNTGTPGDDPSIQTGDAETEVVVENSGNSNVYGAGSDWEMPEFDFNFNFSFNLGDLLEWLGL